MRYNPGTPQPPRAGGGERTIPHADAIAVRDVSKRYATRDGSVAALEGISFDIGEGDFVVVVGPSGCGKTTLLKILAEDVRVELPHPRPLDVMNTPAFGEHVRAIRRRFAVAGRLDG